MISSLLKMLRLDAIPRFQIHSYSVIKNLIGAHLATVGDVDVDGKVRIDQAHLVLELLGHALSSSVAGQHCIGTQTGSWV